MKLKILNKSEKRAIENKLKEQFGIESIPKTLIRLGKKFYLFSGDISKGEIFEVEKIVGIKTLGLFFAEFIDKKDLMLSIEGTQILKNQIRKNIFYLKDGFVENWLKGKQLNIETKEKGLLIIKNGEDFLGTGKASKNKIGNFIPKNKRLRYGD